MFDLQIKHKYLWFPVKNNGCKVEIRVFSDENQVYEFNIETNASGFDFYSYWNVEQYIGKTLSFVSDASAQWESMIKNEDTIPDNKYENKKALIHFTSHIGWINDPNGLIYHNDVYHMYFQHNPYGIQWSNMHWGHAQSTDLFHWEESDDVLYPDENGAMFSGCAFADKNNEVGYGENAVLYYYTAAALNDGWSKNKKTTQRLAYSIDNGKTLVKSDRFFLDNIIDANRDPKVFYHQATNAYIMVLYLADNDFAIFRSKNLTDWEQTQKLALDKAWECPDLFELPIDGRPNNTRWVFWSADGYYFIGDFDGYKFTPTSERLNAYSTILAYAAQTYSNIDNRIISQSWLRTKNHGSNHTGVMAIPVALSLKPVEKGEQLTLTPVDEMLAIRNKHYHFDNISNQTLIEVNNTAIELVCNFNQSNSGSAQFSLLSAELSIDFEKGIVTFGEYKFNFSNNEKLDLRIYIDYDVIEIFAQNYTIYFPCEYDFDSLSGVLTFSSTGNNAIQNIDIFELKSNISKEHL